MELVHENKKNYSCDDCGEKFKMKDTLAAHRVKEHNADSIVCDEWYANASVYLFKVKGL